MLPCLVSDIFPLQTPHFYIRHVESKLWLVPLLVNLLHVLVNLYSYLQALLQVASLICLASFQLLVSLLQRLAPATQLLTGANSFNDLRGHYNCFQFEESRQEIQILGDKVRTVFYLPFHHSFLLYRTGSTYLDSECT